MTGASRRRGNDCVVQLYCLPHAGGSSAFFREWSRELPASVKVRALDPPGHGSRFGEPPLTSVQEIVSDLEQRVLEEATEPLALFGHSMGALVAYELTLALEHRGLAPSALFVSAHEAPHLANETTLIHSLPDGEFLEQLERLGGIPSEVLADAELLALLLPAVRADLMARETYRYVPSGPVACSIVALGGADDPLVRPEDLAEWRHHTTRPFRSHLFPSGHFYMKQHQREVLALVADGLLEHAHGEPSAR